MARVDMGNLDDDKIEMLLSFARDVARLSLYGSELSDDAGRGEDAMECLNEFIGIARKLTGITKPEPDWRDE